MTNQEFKELFVNMINNNEYEKIQETMYHADVISNEVDGNSYNGLEAMKEKNAKWYETFEVLSLKNS